MGTAADHRTSDLDARGVAYMAPSCEGFQSVYQGLYALDGFEVSVEVQTSELEEEFVSPDV